MTDATRVAGLQRLEHFLPRAGADYQRRRNFDCGPQHRDNVSCLSPYLRHRLVSEPEVLRATLDAHGAEAAGKFIDEVFWRAYFRGWLAHHPGTWDTYRQSVRAGLDAEEGDGGLAGRLADARAGETGIPAFDAWARELVTHGYLHNHARMWFASIWVFTLELPWSLGADFFLRHLLDGDPASNTLGWRWVSGLHTRGKTYLARRGNITKFTEGRLDPGDGLADEAPALEEDHPPERLGLDLPAPVEPPDDPARVGWLVTEEDCSGQRPSDAGSGPVRGVVCRAGLSPAGVAEPVRRFRRGAVADALGRLGAEPAKVAEDPSVDAVVAWARQAGLDAVHTAYAPYGPVADFHRELERALADQDTALARHVQSYDRLCWPHADRGFFRLKKRIPAMLRELESGP